MVIGVSLREPLPSEMAAALSIDLCNALYICQHSIRPCSVLFNGFQCYLCDSAHVQLTADFASCYSNLHTQMIKAIRFSLKLSARLSIVMKEEKRGYAIEGGERRLSCFGNGGAEGSTISQMERTGQSSLCCIVFSLVT